jgi:hypothetical protein
MTINYVSSAKLQSENTGGRSFLTVMFWIWGLLGWLASTISYFSLTGSIGVGTSAYLAAGFLYWIGGMLLFGLGALLSGGSFDFMRPAPSDASQSQARQ